MKFGKARHFKNQFSEELNYCNENDIDGIIITIRRFEYFIKSLTKKIENDNKLIQIEISKEQDANIAFDIQRQFNVDTNLNYFLDNILKSNLVGIYSYFEHILKRICEICESNLKTAKALKSYKKKSNSGSYTNKYNLFLTDQIIPLLSKESGNFNRILIWNELRNDIVHRNSSIERFNPQNLKHVSLIVVENTFRFLKSDIILEFLSEIENYLNQIINLINERYDLIEYTKII